MKICPNCGSKMKANVNFCTNCGTDIRNVPVENEQLRRSTPTKPVQQPVQNVAAMTRSAQEQRPIQEAAEQPMPKRADQNVTPTYTTKAPTQTKGAGLGQDFAQSMKSFDVNNMWQWFVNSWKHPFAEQNADKWYGWITLLAEDILIALGLFIGSQRASSSLFGQSFASDSSKYTFGTAFELIFFLLLTQVAWIGAAYLAYKVIYNKNKDFLQLTNHVVQTSNLSAIFITVYFIFMVAAGPAGVVMSSLMLILSVVFFSAGLTVVILGDPNPVHDKFYGYILFLVLQIIVGFIVTTIIGTTLISQLGSILHF